LKNISPRVLLRGTSPFIKRNSTSYIIGKKSYSMPSEFKPIGHTLTSFLKL
jgi:hypothetical protein